MKNFILFIWIIVFTATCIQAQWNGNSSLSRSNTLKSVNFANSNTGWNVGDNGTILKSSNGGTIWQLQNSGISNDLYSVNFPSTNIGWTVGDNGKILKTTDGGNNWILQNSGTTKNLYACCPTDTQITVTSFPLSGRGIIICFVVGEDGIILRTENGGTTWTLQNSGTTNNLYSVNFLVANTGWAVGQNGTILNTNNGGSNWISQNSGTSNDLHACHVAYVPSTDIDSPQLDRGIIIIGVVGKAGTILWSINEGINWMPQNSGTTNNLYSIHYPVGIKGSVPFAQATTGWAVGQNGTILKTTNSGTNWITQSSGTNDDLYSVYFNNTNTGFIVGENGTILRTTNGGSNYSIITSARNNISLVPDKYKLWQNYPNPFNPVTSIKFDLPKTGHTKLSVYNILGEEIETLHNGELTAGSYNLNFNASSYASGVYFYRIETGNFIEVKKFVVMK